MLEEFLSHLLVPTEKISSWAVCKAHGRMAKVDVRGEIVGPTVPELRSEHVKIPSCQPLRLTPHKHPTVQRGLVRSTEECAAQGEAEEQLKQKVETSAVEETRTYFWCIACRRRSGFSSPEWLAMSIAGATSPWDKCHGPGSIRYWYTTARTTSEVQDRRLVYFWYRNGSFYPSAGKTGHKTGLHCRWTGSKAGCKIIIFLWLRRAGLPNLPESAPQMYLT